MALNAKAYQALILDEIGASLSACDEDDCAATLDPQIDKLWEMYSDKSDTSLRLQYLYAKRAAIDWLLGQNRTQTNAKLGPFDSDCKTVFTNLLELRKLVSTQIEEEEDVLLEIVPGAPKVGAITQTAPHMVEAGEWPDPNDRAYRGDPLLTSW